jgi:hypothetical protein
MKLDPIQHLAPIEGAHAVEIIDGFGRVSDFVGAILHQILGNPIPHINVAGIAASRQKRHVRKKAAPDRCNRTGAALSRRFRR